MPLDLTQPYALIQGDIFGRAFQQGGVIYKRDGAVWTAPSTHVEEIAAMKINNSGSVVGLVRHDGTDAAIGVDVDGGAVASVNMKVGNVQLTAADVGAIPASYSVGGVHFDGTNSQLTNAALACVDSDVVVFSYWVRITQNQPNKSVWIVDPVEMGACIGYLSDTQIKLYMGDGNGSLLARSTAGIGLGEYRHVLGIVKSGAAAGNKLVKLYINDVDLTYVQNDFSAAFVPFLSGKPFHIGENTYGQGAIMDLAEFWFAVGQDISVDGEIPEAMRRKFITAKGKPVNLGANGELPTGQAPAIFLTRRPNADPATFAVNVGTGGAFTINGTLSAAESSPSDPENGLMVNPMVNIGDMIFAAVDGKAKRLAAPATGSGEHNLVSNGNDPVWQLKPLELPELPGAGTFALRSVDGVLTWVAV